jgi:hypothetical protein
MPTQSYKKDISYNDIIPLSKLCISERANTYRNIVIVISIFIIGSITTSLYQWSSIPLMTLFLFFPIYSIFLFLDYRQVKIWKEKILQAWGNKTLEINLVKEIIKAVPHLPDKTINSMLDTLPDGKIVDLLSKEKRKEIFYKQQQLHKLQQLFYLSSIARSIMFFILICLSVYFSNIWVLLVLITVYMYKSIEINLLKNRWYKIKNKKLDRDSQVILNSFDQHPFI